MPFFHKDFVANKLKLFASKYFNGKKGLVFLMNLPVV